MLGFCSLCFLGFSCVLVFVFTAEDWGNFGDGCYKHVYLVSDGQTITNCDTALTEVRETPRPELGTLHLSSRNCSFAEADADPPLRDLGTCASRRHVHPKGKEG